MSDHQTGAWIDAAQRQPPDAWPRPCVCRHPTLGMYLAVRRWENGKWWLAGHFHDWADDNTIYWRDMGRSHVLILAPGQWLSVMDA